MIAALANHLWQSTVFAAAAGLLPLALWKNHAAAQYRPWLAASVKFLAPFSLPAAMGIEGALAEMMIIDDVERPSEK